MKCIHFIQSHILFKILLQYPGWLEENKSKLSEADLKRYTSQLEVVQQIVAELEKEGAEDDKQHLERMVELMGKVSNHLKLSGELINVVIL